MYTQFVKGICQEQLEKSISLDIYYTSGGSETKAYQINLSLVPNKCFKYISVFKMLCGNYDLCEPKAYFHVE